MFVKDLLPILLKLEEECYNNVLIITYNNKEYIVSRNWTVNIKNGVVNVLVENIYSEHTPFHVGEFIVCLKEMKPDITIEFYSKYSARYFNSSRVENLEFSVRRL